MAKLKMTAAVTSQVQLAEGIYDLRLAAGEIAAQAVPGQFVSLYSKDGSRLLPRPISLCGIDKEKGYEQIRYFKIRKSDVFSIICNIKRSNKII